MIGSRVRRRDDLRTGRARAVRPTLEGLEGRFLLYATTGSQWIKPIRITYSFVPDGTSIGGVASNLQATFDARFGAGVWKEQFAKAAAVWQKVAKINFTQVADNGAPIGGSGYQQGDSRFGDVRIGGYVQPGSQLGFAFLPPPINGGTDAGDIFLNTGLSWQINGTAYDVMTVAVHEFGHALGMHHSTDSTAVMWPAYTGTKQAVITDDISGIRTIYNARQNDYFDANGVNNTSSTGDNISGYLNAQGQLTLSALDSTTPMMIASGDNDWFQITAPAATTGTMVVRMQSKHLSVLSPYIAVYDAAGTTRLGYQSSLAYGDVVSVSISGVVPGQVYRILAKGATTGSSGYGGYAMQVNFSSDPLPAVTVPNTTLSEQANQGGGTLSEEASNSGKVEIESPITQIGDSGHFWVFDDWDGEGLLEEVSANLDTTPKNPEEESSVIRVGQLRGRGHAFTVGEHDHGGEGSEILDLTPRGLNGWSRLATPVGPLGLGSAPAPRRAVAPPVVIWNQTGSVSGGADVSAIFKAARQRRLTAGRHDVTRLLDG